MSRERRIHTVGIIMNGVTGRMGLNQHLRRSILAIMQQGGLKLGDSEVIVPRPLLVGRNAAKLESDFAGVRRTALDDRSDEALWRSGVLHLFRCADHRPPRRMRPQGDRRRQAHL